MRDKSADANKALSTPGRFTDVNEHLRVKEVSMPDSPGVRWVVCHNPAEAAMDAATRAAAVTHLTNELARIADARTRAQQALKKTS